MGALQSPENTIKERKKNMKKHLLCITLLAASLLTACGSKNQEVQSYNIENIVLPSDGNELTEEDKQRQYLAFLENYIKDNLLEPLSEVKNASVTLQSPTASENTINSNEEISVAVVLELQNELSTVSTAELADCLATAVGNTSTNKITIMDTDGNMLFSDSSKNQEVHTYIYEPTSTYVLPSEGNVTEADKQRQYLAYLESFIADNVLEPLSEVKNASVTLQSPTYSENTISSNEEISVAVVLELEDELSTVSTAELANYLATSVGNTSTDEITIMDIDGNILFPKE